MDFKIDRNLDSLIIDPQYEFIYNNKQLNFNPYEEYF